MQKGRRIFSSRRAAIVCTKIRLKSRGWPFPSTPLLSRLRNRRAPRPVPECPLGASEAPRAPPDHWTAGACYAYARKKKNMTQMRHKQLLEIAHAQTNSMHGLCRLTPKTRWQRWSGWSYPSGCSWRSISLCSRGCHSFAKAAPAHRAYLLKQKYTSIHINSSHSKFLAP